MKNRILFFLAALVCVFPLAALAQGGPSFDSESQRGYGNEKVTVCFHNKTMTVAARAAAQLIRQGATMGACAPGTLVITKIANGGNGTFSFNPNNRNLADFSITTSDGTGSATFTVAPGKYSINENSDRDWRNNGNDCKNLTVNPGQTVACTVTNTKIVRPGSISGTTFVDFDRDGRNVGGFFNRLAGVRVYLDANNDGSFDNGEKMTISNFMGNYYFGNLTPETTYNVREVAPNGYTQLSPDGAYDKFLASGENARNLDFVNYNPNRHNWWNR